MFFNCEIIFEEYFPSLCPFNSSEQVLFLIGSEYLFFAVSCDLLFVFGSDILETLKSSFYFFYWVLISFFCLFDWKGFNLNPDRGKKVYVSWFLKVLRDS